MKNHFFQYCNERFPLRENLPIALLLFAGIYLTSLQSVSTGRIVITPLAGIPFLTLLGFMFIMRLFDDLKDVETDKQFFPDRPVASGTILTSYLWRLVIFTHAVILFLNVFLPGAWLPLAVCLGYAWLSYFWFFAPNVISRRLLVAFATHQPAGFLVNLYVALAALETAHVQAWNSELILVAILFMMPVMMWEISRKIKARGTENSYATYSKLLGPVKATIFLFIPGDLWIAGLILFGYFHGWPLWHIMLQAVFYMQFSITIVRFMIDPVEKNLVLKKSVMLLTVASLVIYLVFLFLNHPIEFSWS